MPRDVAHDSRERERLESLVGRLTDAELARPLSDGWTIAAVLAHVAFWDRRAVVLMERWRHQGVTASTTDPHEINDAMKDQWLALPPRVAARLAVDAARLADAAVATADETLIRDMESMNAGVNVQRAEHRAEHLDQIERALAQRDAVARRSATTRRASAKSG
jgi:hypothetical protein